MKKYVIFLAILLLTLFTGLANAQLFVDPVGGPEVWVTSVYNNSGSTLSEGAIVVWDIGSSTGDNDNYVTTTSTADTTLVAGIIYPADILATESGSMVVRATGIPVTVLNTAGVGAGTELCTSGTAGTAGNCSEQPGDPNNIGFCTSANSSGTCTAYISAL